MDQVDFSAANLILYKKSIWCLCTLNVVLQKCVRFTPCSWHSCCLAPNCFPRWFIHVRQWNAPSTGFVVQNRLQRQVLLLFSTLCWASVWMILHKAHPSPSWLCHPVGLSCRRAKCMQHQPMFSIYLCYLLTGWGACWWCAEGTWGAFLVSSSQLSQPWGHVCMAWLSLQQNQVPVQCCAGTSSLPPVSWDNKTYQNILNSTSVALNRKS